MYNQSGLGLDVDRRLQPGRHRKPEPDRPAPPPWAADERSRLIDRPVGEETARINYTRPDPLDVLRMPLPARAQGAALEAETRQLPKLPPLVALLGRCLRALPFGGPR